MWKGVNYPSVCKAHLAAVKALQSVRYGLDTDVMLDRRCCFTSYPKNTAHNPSFKLFLMCIQVNSVETSAWSCLCLLLIPQALTCCFLTSVFEVFLHFQREKAWIRGMLETGSSKCRQKWAACLQVETVQSSDIKGPLTLCSTVSATGDILDLEAFKNFERSPLVTPPPHKPSGTGNDRGADEVKGDESQRPLIVWAEVHHRAATWRPNSQSKPTKEEMQIIQIFHCKISGKRRDGSFVLLCRGCKVKEALRGECWGESCSFWGLLTAFTFWYSSLTQPSHADSCLYQIGYFFLFVE